ncbi:hypothetical protein ACFZDK_23680 [Streptomyces sp. NPDC007901]|uniref:hypothetical protein n=1 Tax=Streptomyces sp. NPDC007901 TaxID=3364785 RepID=UPI0036ECC6AA
MKGPRTVKVAVRHRAGDTGRPRTRSAAWATRDVRLVRPAVGRDRVELECPVCVVAVLAEVRDHGRTRRVRAAWRAVSLLSLAAFAAALAYAVHESGRALPAGQSPPLFPVSVAVACVTLVVTPAAWLIGRGHLGVTLLDAPGPRRGHRIVPVRG